MAALAGIAALIGAGAGVGNLALSASRGLGSGGTAQQQDLAQVSREQLEAQKANLLQQQIVQALVNRRAVAGSSDSFGSELQYDPATNSWVSKLGPLPQAADRAAMQNSITANTEDAARTRLANTIAMRTAADAGSYADTTRRNLQDFRPMPQDQLVGLLTDQATKANRATYDPLRNDVLRSVQRTGTAAGPVLTELGRSEAENLRNSLRDAMITGMTTIDQTNQSRRSGLENAAANAKTLATPQIQNPGVAGSSQGNILASLLSQRSTNSPLSTAYGAAGVNKAVENTASGYNAVRGNLVDPNTGLNSVISGLKNVSTMFGPGGSGREAAKVLSDWFTPSRNLSSYGASASDYQFAPDFTFGSDV